MSSVTSLNRYMDFSIITPNPSDRRDKFGHSSQMVSTNFDTIFKPNPRYIEACFFCLATHRTPALKRFSPSNTNRQITSRYHDRAIAF